MKKGYIRFLVPAATTLVVLLFAAFNNNLKALANHSAEPTEEPSPSPTDSASPEPTYSPTPSPTEEPSPEVSPSPESSPSPWLDPSPSPDTSPTPQPSPSATPTTIIEVHQKQENNQTVNVNTGEVLAVKTPAVQPETGAPVLGFAAVASAAPIGLLLAKFGKGKMAAKKREEETLSSFAHGLVKSRHESSE
jgi:hypothetical protein